MSEITNHVFPVFKTAYKLTKLRGSCKFQWEQAAAGRKGFLSIAPLQLSSSFLWLHSLLCPPPHPMWVAGMVLRPTPDLLSQHLWRARGWVGFSSVALGLALRDTLPKDPQQHPSGSVSPPVFEHRVTRTVSDKPELSLWPAACEPHRALQGHLCCRRDTERSPICPLKREHKGPKESTGNHTYSAFSGSDLFSSFSSLSSSFTSCSLKVDGERKAGHTSLLDVFKEPCAQVPSAYVALVTPAPLHTIPLTAADETLQAPSTFLSLRRQHPHPTHPSRPA